jgi:acylglycerol lipase
MGGAAAFSTYQRCPSLFSGVVFVSPMCKISDEMLPPRWIIDLLYKVLGPKGTYSALGCLPIAPQKGDLRQYSFRLSSKRDFVTRSPTCFVRNPRLATARELLVRTCSAAPVQLCRVCASVRHTYLHTFPFCVLPVGRDVAPVQESGEL